MKNGSSTSFVSRRWLILVISLIVLSTILFAAGVVVERTVSVSPTTSTHQNEGSEGNGSSDPDGGHDEAPSQAHPEQGKRGAEAIFGLDLENPWLVGTALVVWLGLIGALVWLGRPGWWGLLLVATGSVILDIGEVGRQFAEVRPINITFVVLVLLAHVALACLSLVVLLRNRRVEQSPT
jgi:hypothetical protein